MEACYKDVKTFYCFVYQIKSQVMFRNYCKTAIRNLLKNRMFSIINLTGLSLSIAFCLLLFFYIRHEQSYDSFHKKKDRLFRLEMTDLWTIPDNKPQNSIYSFLSRTDEAVNTVIFPLIVGTDLQNNFPEVKTVTRMQSVSDHFGDQLVRAGTEVYKEKDVMYVDDNFFNTFSFDLIKGNPQTALSSPENVVLSESSARKYFGTADVIGKTIELVSDKNHLFKVAAIAKDPPLNSSIHFNVLLPLKSDPDYDENIKERFNHASHVFIVELGEDVSSVRFEEKMNKWVKTYFTDYFKYFKDVNVANFHWYLRPLAECHYNKALEWGHYTNAKNSYLLACLAVIILLIASLNYILLAVSNAAARTQEVGVRKVMGAKKISVILQFWVEAQLLILCSVATGFVLAKLFTPLFNRVMETDIDVADFPGKEIALALISMSLGLGILAGYYPAWLVSKLKAVTILKTFQTFRINPRFSKILVVTQFTACVTMMIAAFVIGRQMNYISNKDLGFDKEQVMMVKNPTFDFDLTKRIKDRLYNYAKTQTSVSMFSAMNGGLDGSYNTNGFQLNGEQKWRKQLTVDYDYFEMLGLKFVEGRPFSRDISSDSSKEKRSAVVNETLFNMLGKTARLGEFNEPLNATIIGVVKDYNFESLSNKIEPQEHVMVRDYAGVFLFKIKKGHLKEAVSGIEKEWKAVTGNFPFDYTFLDESIAKMYKSESNWQQIIMVSCFFAIFIACMGLFGLSAINTLNRTKEIGIRKVLGASIGDILTTLSSSFVVMIGLSIIIATPIAWWIMNKWLEDFAYRISISWWMFVIVGVAALLLALVTVSYHSIRVAMANPVKSLRTE